LCLYTAPEKLHWGLTALPATHCSTQYQTSNRHCLVSRKSMAAIQPECGTCSAAHSSSVCYSSSIDLLPATHGFIGFYLNFRILYNTQNSLSKLFIPLSSTFIWTCRFNLLHTAITFYHFSLFYPELKTYLYRNLIIHLCLFLSVGLISYLMALADRLLDLL